MGLMELIDCQMIVNLEDAQEEFSVFVCLLLAILFERTSTLLLSYILL